MQSTDRPHACAHCDPRGVRWMNAYVFHAVESGLITWGRWNAAAGAGVALSLGAMLQAVPCGYPRPSKMMPGVFLIISNMLSTLAGGRSERAA